MGRLVAIVCSAGVFVSLAAAAPRATATPHAKAPRSLSTAEAKFAGKPALGGNYWHVPVAVDAAGKPEQLFGFADLHSHFFTQIGFGGRMFAGSIHSCIGPQGAVCKTRSSPALALPDCERHHGTNKGLPFQEDENGVSTIVPEGGHHRAGFPDFKGWPTHTSTSHQQMYVDWLRRAWKGGLRLVHMDVVNNPVMARLYEKTSIRLAGDKTPNSLEDDWNVDKQIAAARAFAKLPDVKSWLAIAHGAAEARDIVRAGKLAVVLGVELDDLFGFASKRAMRELAERVTALTGKEADALRAKLRPLLKGLYDKGVRHIFPIHLFDTVFGGAAVYDVKLEAGNYLWHKALTGRGKFFEVANKWATGAKGSGIFMREDVEINKARHTIDEILGKVDIVEAMTSPPVLMALLPIALPILTSIPIMNLAAPTLPVLGHAVYLLAAAVKRLEGELGLRAILSERQRGFERARGKVDPIREQVGYANKRGLSPAGKIFVEETMRLGMIVDVSHMSERGTEQALGLAEKFGYPLIAGHSGFREMSFGSWTSDECATVARAGSIPIQRCINELGYFTKPKVNDSIGWNGINQGRLGIEKVAELATERNLSRAHLMRIRDLGGMVGVRTLNWAMPISWRNRIAPDCDGSTKGWVQHYLYAVDMMRGRDGTTRGIALGTDANGFVKMLGPRFGTLACSSFFEDKVRGGHVVAAQAERQKDGVHYRYAPGTKKVFAWDKYRFAGSSTLEKLPPWPGDFALFLGDLLSKVVHDARPQRRKVIEDSQAIWAGLARFKAGAAPDRHFGCDPGGRGVERDASRYAYGFWLASKGKPRPTCDCGGSRDRFSRQGCIGGDTNADSKSSWDVFKGRGESEWWDPNSGRTARVKRIWEKWHQMQSKTQPPLEKSVTGKRDFDYNLDGLAHYGMLPDMLQDARNIGLKPDDLAPLFRSAGDYVAMWYKIEERRADVGRAVK